MVERGNTAYLIEGQTLQHKFIHGIKFQIEYIIIIFYLHKKKEINYINIVKKKKSTKNSDYMLLLKYNMGQAL